ncbi:conserved repeat domain protein [Psychromonas sp. CNPT3]|uniref:DUF11 domain-containing protein n=1 Tax=Psychromonas sp. CNPT3 TaxID=314282 RepID=UPI0002C08654|nr:DUF11 domain-containing protein [Psychromonas sp. CNPT3]AGH80910.1 conserved repeat domain protein [Psychromonas sp. CNPT3]
MIKLFSYSYRILFVTFISCILSLFSLQALASDLSIDIQVDQSTYENNAPLVYQIKIKNNSSRRIRNISVNADFTSLQSNNQNVFVSSKILGQASLLSNKGDFVGSGDLLVSNAQLRANGTLTYTVTAVVSDELLVPIDTLSVKVTSDSDDIQNNAPIVKAPVYKYSLSLIADKSEYQINNSLTYTLKVKNTGSDKIQHLSLQQDFMSLLVESIDGTAIPAFSQVSISAKKNNADSNVGNSLSSDDLQIEKAIIATGDTLTYTIQTTITDNLVGDINLSLSSETDRSIKKSIKSSIPPAIGYLEITQHKYNSSSPYYVDSAMSMTLTISNTSNNIVSQYHVRHNIADLITNNANDLDLNNNNSSDQLGPVNSTWAFSVVNIGSHSTSELQISGAQTDKIFDDLVSIYPGEKIEYEISANISPVSIGDIKGVTARIFDSNEIKKDENKISEDLIAATVLDETDPEIQITKSTLQGEYVPGGDIVYNISVKNTSDRYFANNLQLTDNLTCIKSEQSNNAPDGPAFSSWKLEVIKGNGAQGSDPGQFSYNVPQTGDLQISVDIAPGKEIKYKLTATVSTTNIGHIVDNDPACNDNISETGTGLDMPDFNLSIIKDVNIEKYAPGSTLIYTVKVGNTGDGIADNIRVFDDLGAIMVTDINGAQIPAYDSWEVTASSEHIDGSPTQSTVTGINGTLQSPDKFDVYASIEAHTIITYRIKVHITATANGTIDNNVRINNSLTANRMAYPYDPDVSFAKSAQVNDLLNNTNNSYYSKGSTTVTYKLLIKNKKQAGFAIDVKLIDTLTDIEAEILHAGGKIPAFNAWTTSVDVKVLDPSGLSSAQQAKLIAAASTGVFDDDTNINTTIQIPANIQITYTIIAKIDRSDESKIIWGTFTNHATLEMQSPHGTLNADASITPKPPRVTVLKTTSFDNFTPGQKLSFDIYVFNSGQGYANNVQVTDNITALNIFEPNWTLEGKTDTHPRTGSNFDTTNTLQNGQNIATVVDLDPADGKTGTYGGLGFVAYTVTGIVKNDYVADNITNTVKIYDPLNNTHHSSTASVGKGDALSKLNVSILKVADQTRMIPGEDLIYSIMIVNNSETTTEENLTVTDMLTEIKGVLANSKDKHYPNLEDQSPFDSWQIKLPGESSFGPKTNDDFIYPAKNLGIKLTLSPGENKIFKIKVHVKDNFVGMKEGNTLSRIISNTAFVYKDYADSNQLSKESLHEINLATNHLSITKVLLVNGKPNKYYGPGDTLTYRVTYASKTGYTNDRTVKENITDVRVLLMNGSSQHPFKDVFSVDVSKISTHGGDGTTDGRSDGTVENNQNINTIIDIASGDSVTYQVIGTVRNDAVGDITIGGITVESAPPHLSFFKTTQEKNYLPDQPLNYILTVKNTGGGNAYNIPILDELSKITVDLIDGNNDKAFPSGWTITDKITDSLADMNSSAGTYADDQDLNTHFSLGKDSKLQYFIEATVHPKAIGNIVNNLTVNANLVSNISKPAPQKFTYKKEIIAYYEPDGVTKLASGLGGYKPDGYVEYQIKLRNEQDVHLDNLSIKDDIGSVMSACYSLSNGQTTPCPAFDHWTITAEKDNSGITDAGSYSADNDLNTNFDLAAKNASSGDSFLTYTIKAHIKENVVGDFINSVTIDSRYKSSSARSHMLLANIKKMHKAYTDDSLSIEKTIYDHTIDGEKVVYHLRLENKGQGLEYGKALTEAFSKLKVKLAQITSGQIDNTQAPVYDSWTLKVSQSNESMTSIGNFVDGNNKDIDLPYLSIAAGGWIDFVMQSDIRPDTLENVKISPKYDNKTFASSTIKPLAHDVSIDKKIISIGGRPYTSAQNYYLPGDEVIYEVIVDNKNAVWFDNILLRDIISGVHVEVIGGSIVSAFTDFNITNVITTGLDSKVDTLALDYLNNADLILDPSAGVDIAPEENIIFLIKANIREDALGDIDANVAYADNHNAQTAKIPPAPALISFEKSVASTTAESGTCTFPSSTGKNCNYNPEGQVTYQLIVSNNGDGIANDIHIEDFISKIKVNDNVNAFTSNSVSVIESPDDARYSINGNFEGRVDLDARLDLMPGDKIIFEMLGTVSARATGDILNTAKINSKPSNTITLSEGTASIHANKTSDTESYIPGQKITYSITISNTSEVNTIVSVIDPISMFLVETADGTEQTALENWTIESNVISDATSDSQQTYTDISTLPLSGDINAQIKMAASRSDTDFTKVEIKITGNIRSDAIGKFTNIATINGRNYKLDFGNIVPVNGTLEVEKTITKATDTYLPNEVIGFDVQVSNVGDGYLTNVLISDLVSSIRSDFAGQTLPGQVFDIWDTPTIIIEGDNTNLTQQLFSQNDANGFNARYNIAPHQKIKLHFQAKVNAKTMGDITNTVDVEDDKGTKQSAFATYRPEKANVTVTKVVDKSEYESGDKLTYVINIVNSTGAWAKDVHITDLFSLIESANVFGKTSLAFKADSLKIQAISATGNTLMPLNHKGDIDGYIDISPNDTLTITASADLLEDIYGDVINEVTVQFDGQTSSAQAKSIARIPGLIFTKSAPVLFYTPGEPSDYILTIKNDSNSYASDIKLKDIISGLRVNTIDAKTEPAFDTWNIKSKTGDVKTIISDFEANNADLDVNITLAPNDTVEFTISGLVNKKAVGRVNNNASLEFNNLTVSRSAFLLPAIQNVTFVKSVADGTKEGIYTANEEASFFLTLTNNANSFARGINIVDLMDELTVNTLSGKEEAAFSDFDISYKISNDKYDTSIIETVDIADALDINIDLAPNARIKFTLTGRVNADAIGPIINNANMTKNNNEITESALLQPAGIVLVVTKIADKKEYINTDLQLTYTLNAYNRGSNDASAILLTDEISALQNAAGTPLFTDWITIIKEMPSGKIIATQNNVDLNTTQTLKASATNSFLITVIGSINKGINDNITNTFNALAPTGETARASVSVHVKKYADNEGQLLVTKRALKDIIQVGEVVEYEVLIENNNESEFKGVVLEDRYPSGFQYVPDSAEITHSGEDGILDNSDDVISYTDPSISNVLHFNIGDLLISSAGNNMHDKVRVRYLLRASVGTTFGKYINTAYARAVVNTRSSGALSTVSNLSSASVEIAPDKVFDTASVIGKVFEDHNQDGYQADATATGIIVHVDLAADTYISGSTTLTRDNKVISQDDIIDDLKISRLMGLSQNRTLSQSNTIIVSFNTLTPDYFAFSINSNAGSHITFSKDNNITINHSGDKAKGLRAENLNITRSLYADGKTYLWEIKIENIGLYEDGIPGIKLLSVDGITIETDEYGRYHLPDQWVLNKKGTQTLIKLDTDSLPTGMHVISENPKVLRISPNKLTKFNFSVHKK